MANENGVGGNRSFEISVGSNLTIDSFGYFGTGEAPAPDDLAELDTLVFSGPGLTPDNMLLRQIGADVLVTFAGVPNTSATPTGMTIERLENIAALGNFQFDGEVSVHDSIDVWAANRQTSDVARPNTVTFLNDLANNVAGVDGSKDVINGLGGNDKLNGMSGDDVLRGGDGNDLLDGGTGADRLEGGKGNDVYVVDSSDDVVSESVPNSSNGGWVDEVRSSVSFSLVPHLNIERLTLTGDGNIAGTGNAASNTMAGNTGNNTIAGRDGHDHLSGNAGDDTLEGGRGNDQLVGGTGNDYLDGGTGVDTTVFIGDRSDYVFTQLGNDQFSVTDKNAASGDEGTDFVTNVEVLRFANGEVGIIRQVVDTNSGTNEIAEGSATGTIVDITAAAVQSTNSPVLYSLTDNAGGRFAIDPSTGVVSVANGLAIDYETAPRHDIIVRATDPFTGLYKEQLFQVAVTDVPDESVGTIDLATLGADRGFHIFGAAAGDYSGLAVHAAGDVNGDGIDDVIIGATGAGDAQAYLVYGKAGGVGDIDLAALTAMQGIRIGGAVGTDYSPVSVSSAGDINGDGYDDLIVGASTTDPHGRVDAGESYVIYGKGDLSDIDVATLSPAQGFRISGASTYDYSGYSVSGAGDVNGDGIDDVIIGARGAEAAYVVYGQPDLQSDIDLANLTLNLGFQIHGGLINEFIGRSVSGVGDINGDGLDDVIVGAPFADGADRYDSGKTYVIYGKTGGSAGIDVAALTPQQGFTISGAAFFDDSGWSVSNAGDVNGDGINDLIIGAVGGDSDVGGRAFVVYGSMSNSADIDLAALTSYQGFVISHSVPGNLEATSVSSAGDINGDGIDDLIVNATYADALGRTDAGHAYVVYGRAGSQDNVDLANLTTAQGFEIAGAAPYDHAGASVSAAGDLNGDGFGDLVVGASRADPLSRMDAGEAYVIYGGNFTAAVTRLGTPGDDTLVGAYSSEVLIGGLGNDTLQASGMTTFYGGAGNDRLVMDDLSGDPQRVDGGTGIDTLAVDAFTGPLDLTGNLRGRFQDVEIIDLAGGNANTLLLDSTAVAHLAGSNGDQFGANTLLVKGDVVDFVDLVDQGWSRNGDVSDPFGQNGLYAEWTNGSVTVLIDTQIGNSSTNNIDLAELMSDEGITISGIAAGDSTGSALSRAGDINGDGIDDIILGVPGAGPSGRSNAGQSYVIYGQEGGLHDLDLASFGIADGFRIAGAAAGDQAGGSVGSAGDVNGDGIDDLIIGAVGANANTGQSYVVYGQEGGLGDIDLATLNTVQGFSISGIGEGDFSGMSVNSAGDINGDGFDDVIVGSLFADPLGRYDAGESYVIYGSATGPGHVDLATLTADQGFKIAGATEFDASGRSVSSAGDINGDGIDDFAVAGVYGTHAQAFIVYGNEGGLGDIDLNAFSPTQGFMVLGTSDFDSGGFAVSSAGDVNGDGFDDILLGDSSARPPGRHYAGESYVIYGASDDLGNIELDTLSPTQGFRISGATEYDFSGHSVSSAGDVNGDGFDDLIVGSGASPSDKTDAGQSYVIFGAADGPGDINLAHLTTGQGFKISGAEALDHSGSAVSAAGDVNHDGFDDLFVGAPGADPHGTASAGEAYVIYGREDFGSGSAVQLHDVLSDGGDLGGPPPNEPSSALTVYAMPPQSPLEHDLTAQVI